MEDSGTLHGNTAQVDIWRGTGDQTLKDTVNVYGVATHNLLWVNPPQGGQVNSKKHAPSLLQLNDEIASNLTFKLDIYQ